MSKLVCFLTGMLILAVTSWAQPGVTLSGRVSDSRDNSPLAGVTVTTKDGKVGVKTDANGSYSITVPSGKTVLVFSFVGYETVQKSIGSAMTLDVAMSLLDNTINEVIVTANAIKRDKKSLGYSAPTLKNDELTKGQSPSVLNSLQGKVAGVNITSTAGAPGSSSRVVLRGGSSLTGNNQALIVVDGIPIDNSSVIGGASDLSSVDFGNRGNDINPDDIESVTVLKGPAAAALYGSRASNGALIITTKSGKRNQNKKNEIAFSTGATFSNILKLPDYQNQYGQGYDEGGIGAPSLHFDPRENWSWGPAFDGVVRPWGQAINGVRLERPYSAVKNNVKDFFEVGRALNNNLSLSGAGEKSTYYLSLNALNSDGIMPGTTDQYNRYNVRFNGTTQLSNKFSSSLSLNYTRINSSMVAGGQANSSVWDNVLQTPRNIPLPDLKDLSNPYYSMGGFFDASLNELFGYYGAYTENPYYILKNYSNKNNVDRVTGNFTVTYKPLDWLDITERLGADVYSDRRKEIVPKYRYRTFDRTTPEYRSGTAAKTSQGGYKESTYNISDLTHDLMITMRKEFNKDFSGSLLLGNNLRSRTANQLISATNTAGGLVIPGYYNIDNSNGPVVSNNSFTIRRLVGLYADLNLSYKNMLFFGATARNDWSSTLPKQNNSYFYPSVNGAFVFSELLKDSKASKWLQYGKLRASWAQVGNDADPYSLLTYYEKTVVAGNFGSTVFPLGTVPAYTLGNLIGNPHLKPERTTAFEVGTELGLFNNRVSVDFSYYENKSTDQIISAPIAASTGYTARVINIGQVKNKGIELAVRVTPVKTSYGLTWEVYGTYTRNRNEVSGLDVDQIIIGGFRGMDITAANGRTYGNFYAQDLLRDDQGRVIINPANGLPRLTPNAVYLGSYNPDYIASLGTNLSYKNWSLGVLFDTKQGGKFYSRTKGTLAFVGASAETAAGDRTGYIFPNSVYLDVNGKPVVNTQYKFLPQAYYPDIMPAGQNVLDASYIKLRELSLSYTLPKKALTKTPFGSLSISLFGNNLWIKTAKENKYVDPEVNSSGAGNVQGFDFSAQPSVRNYGVNIKVTF